MGAEIWVIPTYGIIIWTIQWIGSVGRSTFNETCASRGKWLMSGSEQYAAYNTPYVLPLDEAWQAHTPRNGVALLSWTAGPFVTSYLDLGPEFLRLLLLEIS